MAKAYVMRTGDVAELVISAPPLNLFDGQLAADLESALDEVAALIRDGAARAVLLRAEGKVFCAGVDVHEFQGLGPSQGAALMARFLALVQTLERMPVPTIAVVHALNLTIGFELSLGCDLMWAAEDASFGLVEATVGLTPGGGGTQRLVARAGVARAAELVMTGDIYPAAEMHQWGVVNRILPRRSCSSRPARSRPGSPRGRPRPPRSASGCCRPRATTAWRPPTPSPRGRPARSSPPVTCPPA